MLFCEEWTPHVLQISHKAIDTTHIAEKFAEIKLWTRMNVEQVQSCFRKLRELSIRNVCVKWTVEVNKTKTFELFNNSGV